MTRKNGEPAKFTYIGRDRACNCIVNVASDIPDLRKEVASWVRDGLIVSRHEMTEEFLRDLRANFGCSHRGVGGPKSKQMDLPLGGSR